MKQLRLARTRSFEVNGWLWNSTYLCLEWESARAKGRTRTLILLPSYPNSGQRCGGWFATAPLPHSLKIQVLLAAQFDYTLDTPSFRLPPFLSDFESIRFSNESSKLSFSVVYSRGVILCTLFYHRHSCSWEEKYLEKAVMIFDKRPQVGTKWDRSFWASRYYVTTVGDMDKEAIKKYIAKQQEESYKEGRASK